MLKKNTVDVSRVLFQFYIVVEVGGFLFLRKDAENGMVKGATLMKFIFKNMAAYSKATLCTQCLSRFNIWNITSSFKNILLGLTSRN